MGVGLDILESLILALECFPYMNHSLSSIDWLLESLDPSARLFHTGQYCGRWKASTHGLSDTSFHLVVSGECWIHFKGEESRHLSRGDAIFILRGIPYWLSNEASAELAQAMPPRDMTPFTHPPPLDGVGLVCGFFDISPGIGQWVLQDLPAYLMLRASDNGTHEASSVFNLILDETRRSSHPSPSLLTRLSDLLLIYVLRERIHHLSGLGGVLGLATSDQFRPLLEQLIDEPGQEWSLDSMADVVGMSRSAFFKRFSERVGQSPGQTLLALRMHLAARYLKRNGSVTEAADLVGYKSIAAFTRAFARHHGQPPGSFRRRYAQWPVAGRVEGSSPP